MLLVIPSLALHKGHCSYLIRGEKGTELHYLNLSDNPPELCLLWRRENAKTLNITDFDTIFENNSLINPGIILYLTKMLDIPVQVLGNFKTIKQCKYLLDNGVYRVILSELCYKHPEIVTELVNEYSASRIAVFVNSNKNKIKLRDSETIVDESEYINIAKNTGITRLVIRDDLRYDTDFEPNYELYKNLAKTYGLKITVHGCVSNYRHLLKLQKLEKFGIDSVIIGKALYENKFPCQNIWRQIEAELDNKN